MGMVDYAILQNLQFLVAEARETNRLLRIVANEPLPEPPPPQEKKPSRWART